MDEISDQKATLLAILAHPDDETFGMGGTLALYARRGVNVHLVCATNGEAGQVDPAYLEGFNSIAERRISELNCAAQVLGISAVHLLNYHDSGMPGTINNQHPQALAAAPTEEVAKRVAHYIRQIKPQIILTHDPIGGYKHPDHIATHKATREAFDLAGSDTFDDGLAQYQTQKLYYHVMPKKMLHFWLKIMPLLGRDPHKFGRNADIDLPAILVEGNFPVHVEIDIREVENLKDKAMMCHLSQLEGGPPRKGIMSWLMRHYSRKEQFMRAYPPAEDGLSENDLFAGIKF